MIIKRFTTGALTDREPNDSRDLLAVEEPLEIRLEYGAGNNLVKRSIAITMRTPGDDAYLAAGFLFTEGILTHPEQIAELQACGPQSGVHAGQNIIRVKLKDHVTPHITQLERHFYATSSCGICGKASLDAVMIRGIQTIAPDAVAIRRSFVARLPAILRSSQPTFDATGGNHAAALVTAEGQVRACFEDVGRHNAVDKVIGSAFLAGRLNKHPATERTSISSELMIVSGRAGFELVQKSLVAGIPALLAIGAPSSLAVSLAERFGMTLIGFMRDRGFNVYSGGWRIHD